MTEHMVELSKSNGQMMRMWIRLKDGGGGNWRTIDKGYLCQEDGVVDTGHTPPTNPLAWVALYGGNVVDDKMLVLHLDNFKGHTGVNRQGEGWVYPQDDLLLRQGKVSWRLVG